MNVKILARKGRSVLIEWTNEEGRQRSYVPYDSVYDKQGQTVCDYAEVGIAYGIPWSLLAHQLPTTTGIAFQQEMRRLDVWTADDLKRKTAAVNAAIRQVGGRFTANRLSQLAAEYLQGANHE